MRVLLDTNILARAAGPVRGLAHELVRILTHYRHELLLSPFIVTELARVLRYDRVKQIHGLVDDEIDQFIFDLVQVAWMVSPIQHTSIPGLMDKDDELVVHTAIEGEADVLCTLDRHLLQPEVIAFCNLNGIDVVTDRELIARLRPPTH
jgi:putative PIN family toxin of toxin-antitoxin system